MSETKVKFIAKNGNTLSKADACFRLLGKLTEYTNNLKTALEYHNLDYVHTLEITNWYWDVLIRKTTEVEKSSLRTVLTSLPFMRTLRNPEDMLTKNKLRFNVEDYPLNEVMFALFWTRFFTTQVGSVCIGRDLREMPKVVHELITKHNYTNWQALLFCLMPRQLSHSFGSESYASDSYRLLGSDACLFDYTNITVQSLVAMVKGEVKPEYDPTMFNDHVKDLGTYHQNITTPVPKPRPLPDGHVFASKWWSRTVKKMSSPNSNTGLDVWGNPISVNRGVALSVHAEEFLNILKEDELC